MMDVACLSLNIRTSHSFWVTPAWILLSLPSRSLHLVRNIFSLVPASSPSASSSGPSGSLLPVLLFACPFPVLPVSVSSVPLSGERGPSSSPLWSSRTRFTPLPHQGPAWGSSAPPTLLALLFLSYLCSSCSPSSVSLLVICPLTHFLSPVSLSSATSHSHASPLRCPWRRHIWPCLGPCGRDFWSWGSRLPQPVSRRVPCPQRAPQEVVTFPGLILGKPKGTPLLGPIFPLWGQGWGGRILQP